MMMNIKMGQWLIWFGLMMALFIETGLFCTPLISKFMIVGANPMSDMFGWRMIMSGIGSFATLIWWMGIGQQYKGKKTPL
jgi:hypothetical protein